MLKTIPWRMMAWGCSVGVLSGLLVVVFEVDFPDFRGRICEYNQATKHEDCPTYSLFPFLLIQVFNTLNYFGVAITALATIAIGIFTLTLKLSTDRLWVAGEKQRQLYEDTAKRQLRAYIHVTSAELSIHPQAIGGWMAQITIKNFGKTPAYKIEIKVEKKILTAIATNTILEFSSAAIAIKQGESALGPGDFITLTVDFSEIPRNWIDWARLREQETKGYVWGRIDYIDAFNEPNWTTFQMIHHFAQINQFVHCLHGNSTEFRLRNSANVVPRN